MARCSVVLAALLVSITVVLAVSAFQVPALISSSPNSRRGPLIPAMLAQGVEGNVSIGPVLPVCRIDAPTGPVPSPWSDIKVIVRPESGDQILVPVNWVFEGGCEVTGTFRVQLPVGTYSLDLTYCNVENGRHFGCTQLPMTVKVEPGRFTQVSVSVDTGIR